MIAATLLTLICSAGLANGADLPVTIVTLGDTLINGFKIDNPADRFSAKVAAGLLADDQKVVFQDAGTMDDTAGDLQWVLGPDGQALLANAANHVLIIETGGDECGTLKLEQTKANLDKILAALASKNIPVLVVGTIAFAFCGPDYVAAFPTMFSYLAAKYDDLLYPDFKAGVEGQDKLMVPYDGHPNEAGEAVIATDILPTVEALIARLKAK